MHLKIIVSFLAVILGITAAAETVTDDELQSISEGALILDENNVAELITINYQSKTTSSSKTDKASEPLFVVSDEVWNGPTIEKYLQLVDNYQWSVSNAEIVTDEELSEEDEFIEAVMSTPVMHYVMDFLSSKGYFDDDVNQQAEILKDLWFSLFSRGNRVVSSSSFEHVFLSEYKNSAVSGLHYWLYYALQESTGSANYLGYMKYITLDKGSVLKFHTTLNDADKPTSSMFVGTSPEFDMAIYTLCFYTRPDEVCNLMFSGKSVPITTYTLTYKNNVRIGSVYPSL